MPVCNRAIRANSVHAYLRKIAHPAWPIRTPIAKMNDDFPIGLLACCLLVAASLTACSLWDSSNAPTAETGSPQTFETAFNVPTPSCRHESWDEVIQDIEASNQALVQAVAETHTTAMAQGLSLNEYVSAYEKASRYGLALYPGDDKVTLAPIGSVIADPCTVSSHLPESFMVYIISISHTTVKISATKVNL